MLTLRSGGILLAAIAVAAGACAAPQRVPPPLDDPAHGMILDLLGTLLDDDPAVALQTSEADPLAVLLASAILRRAGRDVEPSTIGAAVDAWLTSVRGRNVAGAYDGRDVVGVRAAVALGHGPAVAADARGLLVGIAGRAPGPPAARVVELATVMRAEQSLRSVAPDPGQAVAHAVREALAPGCPVHPFVGDPAAEVVIRRLLGSADPACAGPVPTVPEILPATGSLDGVLTTLDRHRARPDDATARSLHEVLLADGPYRGGLAQPLDVVFEVAEALAGPPMPLAPLPLAPLPLAPLPLAPLPLAPLPLAPRVEQVLRALVQLRGALPDVPEPGVSSDTVLAQALAGWVGGAAPATALPDVRWGGEAELRPDLARRTALLLDGADPPPGLEAADETLIRTLHGRPGAVLPVAFVALGSALRAGDGCPQASTAALSAALHSVAGAQDVTTSTLVWLHLTEPLAARCLSPADAGVADQVIAATERSPGTVVDAAPARAAAVLAWIRAEQRCRTGMPARPSADAAPLRAADVAATTAAGIDFGGPGVLASLYMELRLRAVTAGCPGDPLHP